MLKTMTFVLATMAALLNAQELLPELAEPAAKHKAADEALDKQKQEAVALAAKSYVSALDGIEKSATTAGQLDLVAAVVKEREAAVSGTLEPDIPAALPKAKLQMSRKALLTKLKQINADFEKRKNQVDAEHLRSLSALQSKAASDPELTKQLAAEKAALLEGGGAASGNDSQAAKQPRGKNAVVNGDFEKVVDGRPEGWDFADHVTVETENGNNFVRFKEPVVNKDGSIVPYTISRPIEIPNNAKAVTVSARCRTRIPKDSKGIPAAFIVFKNADGKEIICVWGQPASDKNGSWKGIENTKPLPKEAVTANITLINCPGQIDFDDVAVTFK